MKGKIIMSIIDGRVVKHDPPLSPGEPVGWLCEETIGILVISAEPMFRMIFDPPLTQAEGAAFVAELQNC